MTYVLFLEIQDSIAPIQYPYHLGTDERIAYDYAENVFKNYIANGVLASCALIQGGKIVDVIDDQGWNSDIEDHEEADHQMEYYAWFYARERK